MAYDGGNGGSLAFIPAGIWIDPGTTVVWKETKYHSVETFDGPAKLNNASAETENETYEFEFTEEHTGITKYHRSSHTRLRHRGAIAVSDHVPTTEKTEEYEPNETEVTSAAADDASENKTDETVPEFGMTIAAVEVGSYILKERIFDE